MIVNLRFFTKIEKDDKSAVQSDSKNDLLLTGSSAIIADQKKSYKKVMQSLCASGITWPRLVFLYIIAQSVMFNYYFLNFHSVYLHTMTPYVSYTFMLLIFNVGEIITNFFYSKVDRKWPIFLVNLLSAILFGANMIYRVSNLLQEKRTSFTIVNSKFCFIQYDLIFW